MVNGWTMKMARALPQGWLAASAALILGAMAVPALAQVYKVVDEDGNVTYTDQAPPDGGQPMDLPDLSVVDTDYVAPQASEAEANAAPAEPTPRELRKMYRDFKITRPKPEETFWGTANQVVVSWGSSEPIAPSMSVRLYVDGQLQTGSGGDMMALTLDRGEHQIYAELLDARGRRIATSDTVTFFVKQHSVNFNGAQAAPKARN